MIKHNGFTIVELVVIIAVIGILATLSTFGISKYFEDSRDSNREAGITSIANALEKYYQEHGEYPGCDAITAAGATVASTTLKGIDASTLVAPGAESGTTNSIRCGESIEGSTDDFYEYVGDGTVECEGSGTCATYSLKYHKEGDDTVVEVKATRGVVAAAPTGGFDAFTGTCPDGFIGIPHSAAFGNDPFCVMKYEARNVMFVPTSQYFDPPWVDNYQTQAINFSQDTCMGCRLMTDEEWMIIAANILSVPSNWSGGSVGSGYVYSGHSDGSPVGVLEANASDSNGYSGTGNASGNQRRTLTLTTGEVIWDFAGNASEWVSNTIASGQLPGISGGGLAWREWTNASLVMNGLPTASRPSSLASVTGLSSVASWSSANGVGLLNSNYNDATTRAFLRGGSQDSGANAGVLSLDLSTGSSTSILYAGFRPMSPVL